MTVNNLSAPATTRKVLELLDDLEAPGMRVCDVGAGFGYFSQLLGERLAERGLDPREHLSACDMVPSTFAWDGIECAPIRADGTLPFEGGTFDVTISIEVVEHTEDPFFFLRELARITKPGGTVIVTTPNVLNMNSRLRTLVWGFPVLFDPLPLADQDIRYLDGHIHPITPYFLAYAALQAGLYHPRFHADRAKRSASVWATLLCPLLWLGHRSNVARLRRRRPALLQQNRSIIDAQNSWRLLTSRTTILVATRSETPVRPRGPGSVPGPSERR